MSWAISFLFLAKGDTKVFIFNEVAANIITLATSVSGYAIWGLDGLGIAFLASYILYFLMVWGICAKKYSFNLSLPLFRIMLMHVGLTMGVFLLMFQTNIYIKYIPAVLLAVVSCWFSFRELDKRIDVKAFLINYLHKKK